MNIRAIAVFVFLGMIAAGVIMLLSPAPGPVPPIPPVPVPTDALAQAWAKDGKDPAAKQLASLYRVASQQDVTLFKTMGDWFEFLQKANVNAGLSGKLPAVKQVIAEEWQKILPRDSSAPFSATLCNETLRKTADRLEALK